MTESGTGPGSTEAFDTPPPRRLRYFHGQNLGARDFQREQEYVREKLKLRMRSLLGYGVVCGLYVRPVRRHDDDCPPDHHETAAADLSARPERPEEPEGAEDTEGTERTEGTEHGRRKAEVRLTSGLAVDCDGNEVVVRGGCVIDLWKALPRDERDTDTVWIGIEYAERPVEPTRAVYNDACAETSDCEYGWTEECYTVRVTGCEPCGRRTLRHLLFPMRAQGAVAGQDRLRGLVRAGARGPDPHEHPPPVRHARAHGDHRHQLDPRTHLHGRRGQGPARHPGRGRRARRALLHAASVPTRCDAAWWKSR